LVQADSLAASSQSYADFSKLRYTLACYNESIRLFPPVPMLPKVATGPTTLRATLIGGGEEDVFIPRGSIVMIE
jgi:cytochrome P450